MAKQEGEIGVGREAENRQDTNREAAMYGSATELVESFGKEIFNKDLRERLRMDWDHNTMDYNSINFWEVFTMFKCDVRQSVAHWRVSKILEGICICSDQLKIIAPLSPTDIPKRIYQALQDGRANEKTWSITLVNPEKEDEKVPPVEASLADFAHFVDMLKTNRELGMHRFDMNRLAYNYFTGGDLKAKVSGGEEEKIVDLNDPKINPRDNYEDLDIEKYLKHIKRDDVQAGLQLMTEWRMQSDGHREMAGQALLIPYGELPADSLFIPLCGRLAARISMSDLQKQDKSGMMGQPQEVAEIDEVATGAFIRFNLPDLAQRRRGGDIRNVQKTQRMAKAMCGLVLNEDAFSQVETVMDEEEKKEKKKIYLCGKKLDGAIITGMKTRYDKSMERVRGCGLKPEEAADMAMTDVFIPCILNNPNDWLTALATTYSVGGNKGAQSLLQNREVFQGFELQIMCRDMKSPPKFPIEWKTFRGFNDLWEYVTARVKAGHIDQPNVDGFVVRAGQDIKKEVKSDNEYFLSTIDDLQGKNMYELFKVILEDKTDEYVAEYVAKGKGAVFSKLPWAEKRGKKGKKGKYPAKKLPYDFDGIVGTGLRECFKAEKDGIDGAIEKLYVIDIDEDTDTDFVIDGLVQTLGALSDADRKKIHS